ncbi:type 2 DNA topoisomerase 6 subunit B-like [Genypterus blacodes]|uniref:type 2 DNA topoisomerase 6 subunit B-like n=1 Tax=Genypterus blacodes TaxID=154954 RepID=UPI003F761500
MLQEIQRVLRLLKILRRQRRRQGVKSTGGLLVLVRAETEHRRGCTVQPCSVFVLTDVKEILFSSAGPCPELDPEELCAFTDLHGPLRLLLSFPKTDTTPLTPAWCAHVESFLHTFSLANAGIRIHFRFKSDQQMVQQVFSVKVQSKILLKGQLSLFLDVTCSTQQQLCVKKPGWCRGGHPVLGGRLPLSIPPGAMDQGLYGELSLQPVTLLSPCLLQYPNLSTQLTHIRISFVLVYSPSNVPLKGPSDFLHQLPSHLNFQEFGIRSLQCFSFTTHVHSSGTVYTVEQEICEELKVRRSGGCPVQQSLLLFLFLQHSDPFTSQLFDFMATEELLEHHLEDILNNNRQAVTAALQSELKDTLNAQIQRNKKQEKLCSAVEVILGSSISIVSNSSNMDFRMACLNRMKVCNTRELLASLHDSMRRVTSWKHTPQSSCYPAVVSEEMLIVHCHQFHSHGH